jgi:hypothetical protein
MRGSAILLAIALLCVAGTNAQFFVNLDKKKGTGSEVGAKADAAVGEAGDAGGLTDQAAALQVRAFRAAMDSLTSDIQCEIHSQKCSGVRACALLAPHAMSGWDGRVGAATRYPVPAKSLTPPT